MSTPHTMKATVMDAPGPASELTKLAITPFPAVLDGFILVKNAFAGIDYVDIYVRTGQYPIPVSKDVIIGQETAVTIAAVSPLASSQYNLKDGDRVVWLFQGGYAEYTAVPARQVIKIPDGVKSEDAVAAFLVGLTALSLVNDAFPVQNGDKVLVHAAAGGLGLLLIQVLKQKWATVIGTAGGAAKCQLAKRFGADFMVDYRPEVNLVEEARQYTAVEGVDLVYDDVGKDAWAGSLDVVKLFGWVVFTENASGPIPPLNIGLLSEKNISVMRPKLRTYLEVGDRHVRYTKEILALNETGKLTVLKHHKTYSLEEMAQAHDDLKGRKKNWQVAGQDMMNIFL